MNITLCIIFFILGILTHLAIAKYAINKSIDRKVLFWHKRAYYLKDLGAYKNSEMIDVIKKVEDLEK